MPTSNRPRFRFLEPDGLGPVIPTHYSGRSRRPLEMTRMQDTPAISNTTPSTRTTERKSKVSAIRKTMCRRAITALTAAILAVIAAGCSTAKIVRHDSVGDRTASRPRTVYVADFDLDAAEVKSEKGLLPPPPKIPGLGDLLPPLPGTAKDPKKVARQLVDEMGASLVKELRKAGLAAQRLGSGVAIPNTGWLVRGVFTSVNQGNQLERAVIGFGKGKTDVQVVVDINDLEAGVPRKFYEVATAADSGKAPGAGPTIILGPAGLAARFVMAGHDLDRNVHQTASLIANEVARRTTPPTAVALTQTP